MKDSITFQSYFKNHPINTNEDKGLGCYEKALEKIESSFDSMLDKHSKIMIIRFDVRYPQNENIVCGKSQVSDFTYNLKRSLNREKIGGGHRVDAKIIHVQEQDRSHNPHHHFAVVVNANAKNKYFPILLKAETLWKNTLNTAHSGLVDYCNSKQNGIIVDQSKDDFQAKYDEAFYQVSYLAKVRGKENREKGSWLIKASR